MGASRGGWLRTAGIAGAGALLLALLVAFLRLHQQLPPGWMPIVGTGARIAPGFYQWIPASGVALGPAAFRRASVLLVVAMWAAYAGAVVLIARLGEPERRRALWIVVGLCLVMHVVLVLMPPVLSADLYRYGLFGKMILAGENPYGTPANALRDDPLWPYAAWTHLRSHYGPTFLWVATAATAAGGGGPVGTAVALKAAVALFSLATCWVVRGVARLADGSDGLVALALYAWNPLVLVEGPGQAHPDAVMIFLALLGVLLWWRGRPGSGLAALLASAAVKYVTSVVLLLAVVKMVAEAGPRRLATAAKLAGVTALVGVALYGPFWGGGIVFRQAFDVVWKGRSLDARLWSEPPATPVLTLVIFGIGLAAALVVVVRAARPAVLELSALLITFFTLFAMHWLMPWYFLAGLALTIPGAGTLSNRALRLATLFVGLLAMFLYGLLAPVPTS